MNPSSSLHLTWLKQNVRNTENLKHNIRKIFKVHLKICNIINRSTHKNSPQRRVQGSWLWLFRVRAPWWAAAGKGWAGGRWARISAAWSAAGPRAARTGSAARAAPRRARDLPAETRAVASLPVSPLVVEWTPNHSRDYKYPYSRQCKNLSKDTNFHDKEFRKAS